jgi:lysophospholipase L1-like esterase
MILPLFTDVRRRSAATFDPASLPGYEWGVDAYGAFTDTARTTAAAATGDDVKGLADLSGNGRHASWSAGGVPKYRNWNGKRAICFNTTNNRLATASWLDTRFNTSLTLYLAHEYLYRGNLYVAFGANSTNFFVGVDASGSTLRNDWYTNATGSRSTTWVTDSRAVVCLRYNGATKRVTIRPADGSGDVTGSSNATANLALTGPVTVGAMSTGGSQWYGNIYAQHLFSAVHTDDQVASMLAYLKSRHFGDPAPVTGSTGAGNTRVICDGDSLTAGVGATTSYPTALATLLGGSYTVTQYGVSAQGLGEVMGDSESQADLQYSASATENVYVLWAGTNDLRYGVSASQVIARLRDAVNRRLTAGWQRVFVLTILPRTDTGIPAGFETARQTVNTAIRAMASSRVVVVDVAADTRIGDAGDELDTTYYATDKVHMVNAGYAVIAQAVADAL